MAVVRTQVMVVYKTHWFMQVTLVDDMCHNCWALVWLFYGCDELEQVKWEWFECRDERAHIYTHSLCIVPYTIHALQYIRDGAAWPSYHTV